jgi:hypothetical protein
MEHPQGNGKLKVPIPTNIATETTLIILFFKALDWNKSCFNSNGASHSLAIYPSNQK